MVRILICRCLNLEAVRNQQVLVKAEFTPGIETKQLRFE